MQITDEQQKTMAVHVKYEIDEFRNLIQESARLKATGGGDNGWVEQGARIKFIAFGTCGLSFMPAQAVWFQLGEPAIQITFGHEGNSTSTGQVAAIIDTRSHVKVACHFFAMAFYLWPSEKKDAVEVRRAAGVRAWHGEGDLFTWRSFRFLSRDLAARRERRLWCSSR